MVNTLTYNVIALAKKDPFDIATIQLIAHIDRVMYYSSIVGTFVRKLVESTEGFHHFEERVYGIGTNTEYYFRGDPQPQVEQWTTAYDGGKFHAGEIIVEFRDMPAAEERISGVFAIVQEIETSRWARTDEPDSLPRPVLDINSDIIKFRYFASPDGRRFFIFELWHPEETARIVKEIR